MQIFNIHQAKTQLSKLVEKTQKGEEVIIGKSGKPVATLTAYKAKVKPRKLGLWKGKVFMPENFNDEDQEINKLFYGNEE